MILRSQTRRFRSLVKTAHLPRSEISEVGRYRCVGTYSETILRKVYIGKSLIQKIE